MFRPLLKQSKRYLSMLSRSDPLWLDDEVPGIRDVKPNDELGPAGGEGEALDI